MARHAGDAMARSCYCAGLLHEPALALGIAVLSRGRIFSATLLCSRVSVARNGIVKLTKTASASRQELRWAQRRTRQIVPQFGDRSSTDNACVGPESCINFLYADAPADIHHVDETGAEISLDHALKNYAKAHPKQE